MIPHTDNEEARAVGRRRDIGDSRGGSSVRSSRNTVRDDLYSETTGKRGTVGGVTATIQSVCRGEGLQGGWTQEIGLMEPRGDKETTLGRLDRNIAGR